MAVAILVATNEIFVSDPDVPPVVFLPVLAMVLAVVLVGPLLVREPVLAAAALDAWYEVFCPRIAGSSGLGCAFFLGRGLFVWALLMERHSAGSYDRFHARCIGGTPST